MNSGINLSIPSISANNKLNQLKIAPILNLYTAPISARYFIKWTKYTVKIKRSSMTKHRKYLYISELHTFQWTVEFLLSYEPSYLILQSSSVGKFPVNTRYKFLENRTFADACITTFRIKHLTLDTSTE